MICCKFLPLLLCRNIKIFKFMRKINFWLWNLTISLLMIGATTTAAKAQAYRCYNDPYSVSYSGTTLSFYTNDHIIQNQYGYNDNYYYQITDQSVNSVNTTDMTSWSQLYNPSNYVYSGQHNISNVVLCAGSYKLWLVNMACTAPQNAYSTTFNLGSSIGVEDLNNGKINILSNFNFDFQSQPYQYCVYEASETPTTWTTVNSFYADKIANVSKDQNGNALEINTTYKVNVRALNASSCTQWGYSSTFQISTCAEQVTNLQVTDLENGKVNVSWTGTATTPADGYAWAIAQVGFTPSYPNDYRFTTQTSLTNIDTTYNGNALVQGTDYVVYVISACDTLTSYSNRAESDVFNVVTCTSVPSNLVLTQTGTNEIGFSWSAASPVPADGYKYVITNKSWGYTPTISNYTDSTSLSVSNVGTNFTGTNLAHQITYEVYVLGSCGVNSYSTPIIAEITIDNCAGVPTQVSLTNASNGTFSLDWTAPTSAPTDGYAYAIAEVGTTPSFPANYTAVAVNSVADIATTFNGVPLQSGVEYVAYLVSVCETATNTASIVVTDTTEFSTCQATVSNLVVTQNDGALTITFNGNTPAPTDGYVYAVTPINTTVTSAHYVNVASSPIANITNTTNDGSVLAHNAEYVVNVRAACDLSLNYVSAAIKDTVKINNCAAAPTNLVITTTTDDYEISWTEPTPAPADGYKYYIGTNANALANYPSGFGTVLDTNAIGATEGTGAYYVFVVSVCGTSHSAALAGNFSLINCDDTPATITKVETGVNGVNATWKSNGATLPADGFAYAVVRSGYSSPSNINQQATFVQNNLSVSNVTETFDGLPLVDGQNYYFYVYNVCDSTKGYYGYTRSSYFTYRECAAPSNVNLWVNADNTLSATWENTNPTVAHYLYAIGNDDGPTYPLFPLNYTSTNAKNASNVTKTYDNQAFVAGDEYFISVYAVCDATKNIVSGENWDVVTFSTSSCGNVNGYINTTYSNNALSIKYNLYNGSAVPAQGYRYAVIPNGANIDPYDYSKVFTANSSTQTMTGITKNTVDNVALIANQSYQVYLFAVCDSINEDYTSFSTWFTANNEVAYCDEVYDLKLIDNNNKSVTIEWDYDGISPNGYEYAVLPIGAQLQAANFVATPSAPVYNVFKTTSTGDSLVNNAAYAVYVRAKCDATNYSANTSKSITLHSTLAISDIDEDAVKVYPNPVSSTLTIELPTVMAGNSTVTITDVSGKLISVTRIENVVSELNMSELVNGFYLLTIDSEVLQKTIRIVKQ